MATSVLKLKQGGTGVATASDLTGILNTVTGDSGSGGIKGLVPAPSSGDAAANKFLKANGAFSVIQSASTSVSGIAEFADSSETIAASSSTLAVTPSGLAAWAASNKYVSSAQTITNAAQTVLAHGLGAAPTIVIVLLQNATAELGYTSGQQVLVNPALNASSDATVNRGFSIIVDSTNVTIRLGTIPMNIIRADTGATAAIVNANWRFVIKAIK